MTNKAYQAKKKLLLSKIINKCTERRIYNTQLKPVMIFRAETLTVTKKQHENTGKTNIKNYIWYKKIGEEYR